MTFLAPIWLTGLIAWAGVAVWVLLGERRRAVVPFLDLWRGPVRLKPPRRQLEAPPAGALLLLGAALMGVLAASRPAVELGETARVPLLTIIYDAGLTMSGPTDRTRNESSPVEPGEVSIMTRGHALTERVLEELPALLETERMRLVVVPHGTVVETDPGRVLDEVRAVAPTAVDTTAAVEAAVRDVLARPTISGVGEAVLVISDRRLDVEDDRVVQIAPEGELENVGIVRLEARRMMVENGRNEVAVEGVASEGLEGQVLVRLRNQLALDRTVLRIESGEVVVEREIDLPAAGSEADLFVDVPNLGRLIRARLMVDDDLPADNVAWLVLSQSWPRVARAGPLPGGVERMIEIYGRARPAEEGSQVVVVARDVSELGDGVVGVVVEDGGSPETSASGEMSIVSEGLEVEVEAHPVTEHVEWHVVLEGMRVAPAPAGWRSLVWAGDTPVIAVRENQARQVWVGGELSAWSRRGDFVVFWTNVFDWLGGGSAAYVSQGPAQIGEQWSVVELAPIAGEAEPGLWPGVYEHEDGRLLAVNAPPVWIDGLPALDWRERLVRQQRVLGRRQLELSPALALLGVVLVVLSALVWKRRRVVKK
jgi:hypothetical protein